MTVGSAEPPDDAEATLTGGTMSVVVRRGDAVHRSAGPWTPTVHRLLDHLREQGIDWLPRPVGVDATLCEAYAGAEDGGGRRTG